VISALARSFGAVQARAHRNVLSPPPIPAVFLKATKSTQSLPGEVCGSCMPLGWPLNRWPSAPQTLRFQALFCAHPPAPDHAIPPGFCPFRSLIMGCLEECLSSISAAIHKWKKADFFKVFCRFFFLIARKLGPFITGPEVFFCPERSEGAL
jgi:hypothetical protein